MFLIVRLKPLLILNTDYSEKLNINLNQETESNQINLLNPIEKSNIVQKSRFLS